MAARHGYKVGERKADATYFLGRIDMETGVWGWAPAGRRAGAKVFATRREAVAASHLWEAAMRLAGHTPGPIVVVPAHGGVECSRR